MDRIAEVRSDDSTRRSVQTSQPHLESRHDIPAVEIAVPGASLAESLFFVAIAELLIFCLQNKNKKAGH
jgi:hypothetical protein